MLLHPDVAAIVNGLHSANLTIAFAESCTGGRLSADLTTVPGSSDVVVGSAVCYQLRAKHDVLGLEGVDASNVVSRNTAEEMARAAQRVFKADIGVGTTGLLDGDGPHAYWAVVAPPFSSGFSYLGWGRIEFPEATPRDLNREILVRAVMEALSVFTRKLG